MLLLVVKTLSSGAFCAASIDIHPWGIYLSSSSKICIKCCTPLTSRHCWKAIYEIFKKGVFF